MKYEFKRYNSASLALMNEEVTSNFIRDTYLDEKPSREEKELLKNPEEWAKHAFENESQYYMTFYNEDDKPFICVNYSLLNIDITFLEYNNKEELIKHLWMVYDRYDMQYYFKTDELKSHPNNNLFLSQIEVYYEDYKEKSTYKALFKRNEKLMKVASFKMTKDPQSYSKEKKETKVNLFHNFIEPPKHYLDYEHLFDYEEILKSEYLDIPLEGKE